MRNTDNVSYNGVAFAFRGPLQDFFFAAGQMNIPDIGFNTPFRLFQIGVSQMKLVSQGAKLAQEILSGRVPPKLLATPTPASSPLWPQMGMPIPSNSLASRASFMIFFCSGFSSRISSNDPR